MDFKRDGKMKTIEEIKERLEQVRERMKVELDGDPKSVCQAGILYGELTTLQWVLGEIEINENNSNPNI